MGNMKVRSFRMKYGNTRSTCGQGHLHDSRLEARYCDQLELLRNGGEIQSYLTQKRFDLKVNEKHVTTHYVDYLVTNNDGSEEVHEVKGYATREWDLKRKLFEALYPEIPYIVIKQEKRPYAKRKIAKRSIKHNRTRNA